MRSMRIAALTAGLAAIAGCATTGNWTQTSTVREVELTYDDAHAVERPILPSGNFELLMKNEPKPPFELTWGTPWIPNFPGILLRSDAKG